MINYAYFKPKRDSLIKVTGIYKDVRWVERGKYIGGHYLYFYLELTTGKRIIIDEPTDKRGSAFYKLYWEEIPLNEQMVFL